MLKTRSACWVRGVLLTKRNFWRASRADLHSEHADVNYQRHCEYLRKLIDFQLTQHLPILPDNLMKQFFELRDETEKLLMGVLHVAT